MVVVLDQSIHQAHKGPEIQVEKKFVVQTAGRIADGTGCYRKFSHPFLDKKVYTRRPI